MKKWIKVLPQFFGIACIFAGFASIKDGIHITIIAIITGISMFAFPYQFISDKPFYKIVRIIVPILLMFCLGTVLPKADSTPSQNIKPTPSVDPSPAKEPEKTLFEKLTDEFNQIYDNKDITLTQIIDESEHPDIIKISADDNVTYWNDNDFINTMFSRYIDYCRVVYDKYDVTRVDMFIRSEVMDKKGNIGKAYVFKISMPKDNFITYNWENLSGSKLNWDDIEKDCYGLEINLSDYDKSTLRYYPKNQ